MSHARRERVVPRTKRCVDPRALHVAEVAEALHEVFFVLGAAGALGRVLEVLEPRGFFGGLVCGDLAAQRAEALEVLGGDGDVVVGEAVREVRYALWDVAVVREVLDRLGDDVDSRGECRKRSLQNDREPSGSSPEALALLRL